MDFVAIDVETANPDLATICQIGIACYSAGVVTEDWVSYIDPEDYFDPFNIEIHCIDETTVAGSPRLPDIAEVVYGYLDDRISVCHTSFDRIAISRAFDRYGLRQPRPVWLDTARVVRRAWREFAWDGYGLGNVCAYLGYSFTAHDALEDARAAGHILISAINETGLDIEAWLKRVEQPIDPLRSSDPQSIRRDGNPDGRLYGQVLVFTGALDMPRHEAADMAAKIGCCVASGVTKETTLLVVGDQDIRKLAGHEKSAKHRKAESLIMEGQEIRILCESDFKHLCGLAQ